MPPLARPRTEPGELSLIVQRDDGMLASEGQPNRVEHKEFYQVASIRVE